MTESTSCVSDFTIDGYLAGELEPSEVAAFDEHVAGCARCRARFAALRHDTQSAQLPPLPGLEPRRMPLGLVFAVAASVLLAVYGAWTWLTPSSEVEAPTQVASATRTKGAAHLSLYVRRDARVFAFGGEPLRAGDGLAFAYTSSVDTTLALFDVETGTVTPLYPEATTTAPALAGVDVELDFAVELDASTAQESIVGVFCAEATSMQVLERALASGEALPEGCRAEWTSLPKEGR